MLSIYRNVRHEDENEISYQSESAACVESQKALSAEENSILAVPLQLACEMACADDPEATCEWNPSESELVDQCEEHCGRGRCDQLTTNDFVDFVGCKRKGDHRLFWILSGLIRSVFQTQNH